jgi:hypothetical protein
METWIQFVWEIKVCTAIALASSFFSRSFYLFVYLHLETSKKFISQGQIQACTGDPVFQSVARGMIHIYLVIFLFLDQNMLKQYYI